MPHCKVVVHDKGAPPLVIDGLKPDTKRGNFDTCVIIEGGMASGKPSLAFHIIDQDGKSIVVETSAEILDMIQACRRGAEMKWADRNAKNN